MMIMIIIILRITIITIITLIIFQKHSNIWFVIHTTS